MGRADAAEIFIADHHHDISGEDGSGRPIFFVNRRHAPAKGCSVHNIVMDQREVMKELHRNGQLPGIFLYRTEELVAHDAKDRADPFSTETEKIIGRVIEAGRMSGKMPAVKSGSERSGQFFEMMHSLSTVIE
jgi:predicted aconitase with swiveling domain